MRWPLEPSSEWGSSPPEKVSNRGGSEHAGLRHPYLSAAVTADWVSDMLGWHLLGRTEEANCTR